MPEQVIKAGDVVRHRENKIKMTVNRVLPTSIECDWFDKESKPHREVFWPEELHLINK